MTSPRRRLIRVAVPSPAPDPQQQLQMQKLRTRLDQERKVLARWMSRLKRAFHTVEKIQQKIARIERQISKMEDS